MAEAKNNTYKQSDPLCDICEEQASQKCKQCAVDFCGNCDENTHRGGSGKESHSREPIHPPPPAEGSDSETDVPPPPDSPPPPPLSPPNTSALS